MYIAGVVERLDSSTFVDRSYLYSPHAMQERSVPSDAIPVMNQEFRVNRACRLDVRVPGARLRLRHGDDDNRVVVSVAVAGCTSDEANEILDRLNLSTRQVQDKVQVTAREPERDAAYWSWMRSDKTTLYIDMKLPSNTDAEISAPSGEIDADGLHGDIDLIASSCPVQLSNVRGQLRVTAHGKPVTIKQFEGSELVVTSTGALVSISGVRSDVLALRATAGRLSVRNVNGRVDIEANGSNVTLIDIDGPIRGDLQASPATIDGIPRSQVDLRATGGPIVASVEPSFGANVVLEGRPVELDPSIAFSGDIEESRAEGRFNGGGEALLLRAVPGTVRCTRGDS